jgi:hypothetical protein
LSLLSKPIGENNTTRGGKCLATKQASIISKFNTFKMGIVRYVQQFGHFKNDFC